MRLPLDGDILRWNAVRQAISFAATSGFGQSVAFAYAAS